MGAQNPSIVIEIRNNNLIGVYADGVEAEVVCVAYDDDEGPASCQIIPVPLSEMSEETKRWAVDAIERRHA